MRHSQNSRNGVIRLTRSSPEETFGREFADHVPLLLRREEAETVLFVQDGDIGSRIQKKLKRHVRINAGHVQKRINEWDGCRGEIVLADVSRAEEATYHLQQDGGALLHEAINRDHIKWPMLLLRRREYVWNGRTKYELALVCGHPFALVIRDELIPLFFELLEVRMGLSDIASYSLVAEAFGHTLWKTESHQESSPNKET